MSSLIQTIGMAVALWATTKAMRFDLKPHRWVASRYADTRKDEGGTPACWKRIPDADFDRMYDRRCASRTLPCGTMVVLTGPAGPSYCWVLDRGPYGQDEQGRWRGHLDLSPVPAGEVGIWSPVDGPGRVPVKAWVLESR